MCYPVWVRDKEKKTIPKVKRQLSLNATVEPVDVVKENAGGDEP